MSNLHQIEGWLLDVYADQSKGVVLWVIGEDGHRYRLQQDFPVTFFASGPRDQLLAAQGLLRKAAKGITTEISWRKELFEGATEVLAVCVNSPVMQSSVFKWLHSAFPRFEYFDAEIALPIRYQTAHDVFPLALCQFVFDSQNQLHRISALDSCWDLHPRTPPFRILSLVPNSDPARSFPGEVELLFDDQQDKLDPANSRDLLIKVNSVIEEYDPDIIGTRYGDKWLFPLLFATAHKYGIAFNPNREKDRDPIQVKPNTFISYGRIVHRDQQTLLFGRAHIDATNSMSFWDYGLPGTMELARVTGLPLQNAARRSPGGGFTAMQVRAALKKGIMVPVNKKRMESFKTATELVNADRGGLIYQPLIGLHRDVAELDFFSMFPSIMAKWNISPETVGVRGGEPLWIPGLNRPISVDSEGIVASILKPILEKRWQAKAELREPGLDEEEAKRLEIISDTLKALGWVSFGYQGFSGNRIGSIEAHEAINAISREILLRAKEAAEDLGFLILHMYVDCLFVSVLGKEKEEDFQPLAQAIQSRTRMYISIEGVFRWIAFLPSKQTGLTPVPNCYFGVFRDGKIKSRGIMLRKHDTPLYIHQTQLKAIRLLAEETDFEQLRYQIPGLVNFFRRRYRRLILGRVPIDQLKVSQNLSRDLDGYRVMTAAARAAEMLKVKKANIGAGHRIEYLHVKGSPDVLPWDLSSDKKIHLDLTWYADKFLRAAHEILQPFGVELDVLRDWLFGDTGYFKPRDFVTHKPDLPIFEYAHSNREASFVHLQPGVDFPLMHKVCTSSCAPNLIPTAGLFPGQ